MSNKSSLVRLPVQTRVSQVQLRIAKLDRALVFYQSVLGFKIVRRTKEFASLSATGNFPVQILLVENAQAPARAADMTGLFHFAIRFPTRSDLAQVCRRLQGKEYPIEGASNHKVSESIYVRDPDGNGVELYADLPRAQWPSRNGQLVMGTSPLFLDVLLATIEGEASAIGVPPKTDLGHIHFEVADLAAAERFYHQFLSMDVTQRTMAGALFFSAGGYHHHFATNVWHKKTKPPGESLGLVSYRLEFPTTDAIDALRRRVKSFGYESENLLDETETGAVLFRVRDPNGLWLELWCPHP